MPVPSLRRRPSRLSVVVTSAVAVLTVLGACSSRATQPSGEDEGGQHITITDQRGKKVTLDGPAQTIATAVIPAPAIIAAVDRSWKRIVGINKSTLLANKQGIIGRIFPRATKTPVISPRSFEPNMETIIDLDPDLVVQWGDRGSSFTKPIEDAGFAMLGLKYGTQEDLESWLTMFGKAIGKSDRARQMIERMHTTADHVRSAVKGLDRPRAMDLGVAEGGFTSSNRDTYTQYLFDLTGAVNVAADNMATEGTVSVEQILDWDPEYIFLSAFDDSTPQDLYRDPRLRSVTAVQNKQVYKTPLGVYRWQVPCAESPLMWQWMAAILHQGDYQVALRAKTVSWLRYLYGYSATPADLDLTLRMDLNRSSAGYQQIFGR